MLAQADAALLLCLVVLAVEIVLAAQAVRFAVLFDALCFGLLVRFGFGVGFGFGFGGLFGFFALDFRVFGGVPGFQDLWRRGQYMVVMLCDLCAWRGKKLCMAGYGGGVRRRTSLSSSSSSNLLRRAMVGLFWGEEGVELSSSSSSVALPVSRCQVFLVEYDVPHLPGAILSICVVRGLFVEGADRVREGVSVSKQTRVLRGSVWVESVRLEIWGQV